MTGADWLSAQQLGFNHQKRKFREKNWLQLQSNDLVKSINQDLFPLWVLMDWPLIKTKQKTKTLWKYKP